MKKEILRRNPLNRINMTMFFTAVFFGLSCAAGAFAQTTAFTFQGKLNDNGSPANSSYDMRFRLFDAAAGTNQIGSTLTLTNVPTVAGIFTVQLDFGADSFTGGERFIEIGISPAGQNNFVTLAPRQRLTSAPYAVKSINAATAETSVDSLNLGGIAASGYVQTGDARLSDARVPLAGSNDYVQNNPNTPQSSVNFNIDGSGSANILNAQSQFNLRGLRMLTADGSYNDGAGLSVAATNLFIGENAGLNTVPNPNPLINPGKFNSFVGANAGKANTTGFLNSFFGSLSGQTNTLGGRNSFFGSFAGNSNTTGNNNSYFGQGAGFNTTIGGNNSFFGGGSGSGNTTGDGNSFFGVLSGSANATGQNNTLIGAFANVGSGNLTNATAIGFQAQVTQSNSLVLGNIGTKVGIGTTAPETRLHIKGAEEGIRIQGAVNGMENLSYLSFADNAGVQIGYVGDGSTGDRNVFLTSSSGDVQLVTLAGRIFTAASTGNILMSGGPNVIGSNVNVYAAQTIDTGNFKGLFTPNLFLSSLDTFLPSAVHVCARVQAIGGTGGLALTRCSTSFSSVTNKTGVEPFSGGLNIVRRLNPVSFKWKAGGDDVGLNAEEVAEVAPELVTRSEKGEIEDVKENSLSVVFINAIKEQQKQIEAQAEQIKRQQAQLDALKKAVCAGANSRADVCREEQ